MTERESRIHRWCHAVESTEGVDGKLWHHGQAHWIGREMGQRYGNGRRGDLTFGAEWRLFPRRGFGVGWQFKWGTGGSETTPDWSIHLSNLGDLWLHAEGLIPRKWLERHTADGKVEWDTRVFGYTVDKRGIRWDCWAKDGSWSKGQPWWMSPHWEWERLFFGKTESNRELVDLGTTLIPMPEANYPATFEVARYEQSYSKPLGRLRDRVLGKRVHFNTTIEPGKAVLVPGKGENSWDCGDDAIYSLSTDGQSVESAVAKVVESAFLDRRRHGGQHMSMPT